MEMPCRSALSARFVTLLRHFRKPLEGALSAAEVLLLEPEPAPLAVGESAEADDGGTGVPARATPGSIRAERLNDEPIFFGEPTTRLVGGGPLGDIGSSISTEAVLLLGIVGDVRYTMELLLGCLGDS